MGKLTDPTICPECRTKLTRDARCSTCGLHLQGPLATELWTTMQRADSLVAQLRRRPAPAPAPAPVQHTPMAPPMPPPMPTPMAPPMTPPTAGAPTAAPAPHRSSMSIPGILLSLGGLLVLVAALVFVAVTWSSMGIGGRTAIMGLITAVMAVGAVALTIKDLRWAAETFWVIVAGMLVLDVLGARAADLFGEGQPSYRIAGPLLVLIMVGLGVGVATWSTGRPTGRIVSVQVCAIIGAAIGMVTTLIGFDSGGTPLAVAVPLFALFGWIRFRQLPLLSWGMLGLAALCWVGLFMHGALRTADFQPHWWTSLNWWPLALAGLYAGAVSFVRLPYVVRVLAAGMCLLAWSMTVLGGSDVSATLQVARAALMLLFLSALTAAFGRIWGWAGGIAGLLWMLPSAAYLSVRASIAAHTPSADRATSLDGIVSHATEAATWSLALLALGVAAYALAVHRHVPAEQRASVRRGLLPLSYLAVALGVIIVAASAHLPLWLFGGLVTLLLLGGIALAWYVAESLLGYLTSLFAVVPLAILAAVAVATHHGLGAVCATVVFAASFGYWVLARAHHRRTETFTALAIWPIVGWYALASWWFAADLDEDMSLVLLAAYVAVLLLVAKPLCGTITGERIVLESFAGFLGLWAVLSFGNDYHDLTTTIVGAALVLSSLLNRDREWLAYIGSLLLLMATVVRYADDRLVPEAYSLPIALVLVGVGLWRLRQDPELSSMRALGAGVALGLVPSLVLALDDPLTWRGALVFAAGVAVLLIGAFRHLAVPLYAGTLVTAVMALRYLGPWAQGIPRWVGIGIVGLLLLGLGVSWEFGRKNLKTAKHYFGLLR